MPLPVRPPVRPMLAKLARELPADGYVFEPKLDGFRCLAFREDDVVDLRSRHDRPLARYFPEIVESLRAVDESFAIDGEIVARDFPSLMARLHPAASRVERLRRETPAALMAFDLLALDGADLRALPFATRRERLEELLASPPESVRLTPTTTDARVAAAWLDEHEGVVAKERTLPYLEHKRVMVKVKRERTAECVVAGMRWLVDRPLPSSLLLGLYDERGELHHVGIASSFGNRVREALLADLGPLIVPLDGHPWERGFLLEGGSVGRLKGSAGRWTPEMQQEWTPLAPIRVAEVAYDQLDDHRFRHPARFKRWRPDREPQSCRLDQLEAVARRSAA